MCKKLVYLFSLILMLALSVSAQANLLQNGGFEVNAGAGNPADYWANTEEAGVESWAAHTGSWGMAFVTWRGDGTGDFYQEISITQNTPYTYTIWATRDSGTLTGAYYVKVEWYYQDAFVSEDSQLIDITDTWTQQTFVVTSPAFVNKARIMISGVNVNIVGKFDDAEFVDSSPAPDGPPTGVVAVGCDSRIDLKWDVDANVPGYNIYRSVSADGTFTKLNSLSHTASVYSDFFGTNNQTYYYYVTAVVNDQESDSSAIVSASSYVMTNNQLLTSVQEATFRYFWDFAHPVSGLAREGYVTSHDPWICATGGTGMGLMAIVVGSERGFVTRAEAAERILKILTFLDEETTRYHGAWAHWINGASGETIPFSPPVEDDGGDLLETSLLVQGMLTAREYFDSADSVETQIRSKVTSLWEDVEWDWYLRRSDSGYESNETLYWHWSLNYGWAMDLPIIGYNECMITYLLAIASPTYPIPASCYYNGWASGWYEDYGSHYGFRQWVGAYDGPLFHVHYSFLGFDPRHKSDGYCNYFYNSRNNTMINRKHCIINPGDPNYAPDGFVGYSDEVWGLTASRDPWDGGYRVHSPYEDNGTVAPTAAISSMPYTPAESIKTLRNFYHTYGNDLWGSFGFLDAFNLTADWFADTHLAIDQGPIVVMIENYRTGLCWDLFMANSEIQPMLDNIGWTTLDPEHFVLASYEADETGLTVTSPDAGVTTLQSVQGGVNGAPAATDGNNVLKLVWTGEIDRKVEVRNEWSDLTFDLAGYDKMFADVYIADGTTLPWAIGIWDDVLGWLSATPVPTATNEWSTVSIDISDINTVCLKQTHALIFDGFTSDNGTIYMDNLRIVDTNAGLLVYFSFDEDGQGTVIDESGSENDGTNVGTPTYISQGRFGGAYDFDPGDYVTLNGNPTAGLENFTVSLWFKTAVPTNNYKLASAAWWSYGGGSRPGSGWILSTHCPEAWSQDNSSIPTESGNRSVSIVANEWTHMVVSYDGVRFKEYINGQLARNFATTGKVLGDANGRNLEVGAWSQYFRNYDGLIDEFRVYDRALPECEIMMLYDGSW